MEGFLTSALFQYFVFPIGSAVLGIAIKHTSRNDQYAKFSKEDLAVGLELVLTACLMFVVITTDKAVDLIEANEALAAALKAQPVDTTVAMEIQAKAQLLTGQLATAGWLIALMFLGLWSISTVIRKWGWKSETEMNAGVGIALPLAFGILALIAVMAGAGQ